jgi:hypothetical protein
MPSSRAHAEATTIDVDTVFGQEPFYRTAQGAAFLGDSHELLSRVPTGSVNLVFTSPPYALHFKKEYGNAEVTV